MAETAEKYQRLTGARSRTAFGIVSTARSSLWLGKDHVLCVEGNGYSESYKRFYFRDIQAVILRRSHWRRNWSLGLGVVAGLFGLFAAVASDSVAMYILGSIAAMFVLVIVMLIAAGPTCVCHLRTAVQMEELPSLNRVRKARRILERLRPLIAQAQGSMSPEVIVARLQAMNGLTPATGEPAASPGQYVIDDPNLPPRIVS